MDGNDDKHNPSTKPIQLQKLTYESLQSLVKTYKLSNQYAFDHLPLKKRILLDLAERKYHHTYTSSDSDSGESEASMFQVCENTSLPSPLPWYITLVRKYGLQVEASVTNLVSESEKEIPKTNLHANGKHEMI